MESTKFFVAKIKIFSHTPNICRRKKFTLIETHVMMTCADERFYLVSPQLGADSPFCLYIFAHYRYLILRNPVLLSFNTLGNDLGKKW